MMLRRAFVYGSNDGNIRGIVEDPWDGCGEMIMAVDGQKCHVRGPIQRQVI